jgi:hypothetical protein
MIPLSKYTPTQVADGQGGYTETLGAATTLFVSGIKEHEGKETLTVRKVESVAVYDVLQTPDGSYYQVVNIKEIMGAMYKTLVIEKTERPLTK